MNARTLDDRTCLHWLFLITLVAAPACSRSSGEPDLAATPYAASGGVPPTTDPPARGGQASTETSESLIQGVGVPQTDGPGNRVAQNNITAQDNGAAPANANAAATAAESPYTLQGSDAESGGAAERPLPPDLTPPQLQTFLAQTDQDMQLIWSGRIGDVTEARVTLIRIVKKKLEASRRLAEHADASPQARSEGRRGQLQAMSHLASFGDLQVAKDLEALARENLESDDAGLIADSRLVLIGFAIESLQSGKNESADEIVEHIDQIAAKSNPGVPALMVMGQARELLADYGHNDKAQHVRDRIVALFANSENPEIAKMAASLAGSVRYDQIETLRGLVMSGEPVAAARWREAVNTLIDHSADLKTVQYLAGAALEFESIDNDELTAATYDALLERFDDPDSATGHEVRLAAAAKQARATIIGTNFDPNLPSVDGSGLSIADFKGKVVLVPFWAINFPDSLQLFSRLEAIAKTRAEDVAVVGINLDVKEAPLQQFLQENDLSFPSFRSESSPTAAVANPIVKEFGMVSMPFTAIIDQQGRVAALDFSGRDLEATVDQLLAR